jgi:hypothetical protein
MYDIINDTSKCKRLHDRIASFFAKKEQRIKK